MRVLLLFALAGASLAMPPRAAAQRDSLVVVEGTVADTVSGRPVPFAVVRVAGTDRSTLSAPSGRYRLKVPRGTWVLEVRKIGYRVTSTPVVLANDSTGVDLNLSPIPVELAGVTIAGERENPALEIIRQAIARKNDVLSRIHDYRYDAYVKLVVRNLGKNPDSAASIVLITETRTTAYWEQPDKYQEVITARRQSSNLDAERNLVSVGQIVNFNRDRIDMGKYSVVSPTADDALQFYDYQVIDTLWDGGRMIFRLAVEPKSQAQPLFAGLIDIADSTFDVRAIDVGANQAVRFELFTNLRYRQRMALVGPDAWMPTEIRFSGELHVGVPIPGFPNHLSFEHLASLKHYRFDQGGAPGTLGEYLIVVDDRVDHADSASWPETRAVPLTDAEQAAWARIDSVENLPRPLGKQVLSATVGALSLLGDEDFFHFNRVEGPYVGAGVTLHRLSPNLVLDAKLGRALDRKEWQHRYGAGYRLSESRRLWVGLSYHDEIVSRPAAVSGGMNKTFAALWDKDDPLDYYHDRGFVASVETKLVDFVRLRIDYNDLEQSSAPVVTQYSILDRSDPQRPNPPIADGRLRSVSGSVTYDSRRRIKRKGRDILLDSFTFTTLRLSAEYAAPGFIGNDFDFLRYSARLRRRQRTLNLGLTTVDLALGASAGDLPPQRYYTVDFGRSTGPIFDLSGFNTANGVNFSGNRLALLRVLHDFDQQLFRRSGIPLIRALPVTFSLYGGVFVTDLVDQRPQPGDDLVVTASSPYGELGFGIGNLTPWIAPLNLSVWFAWQVSSYATDRFAVRIGVPGLGRE